MLSPRSFDTRWSRAVIVALCAGCAHSNYPPASVPPSRTAADQLQTLWKDFGVDRTPEVAGDAGQADKGTKMQCATHCMVGPVDRCSSSELFNYCEAWYGGRVSANVCRARAIGMMFQSSRESSSPGSLELHCTDANGAEAVAFASYNQPGYYHTFIVRESSSRGFYEKMLAWEPL